jgi:short-subunit dehydrogenase involved in D-alanine esterification of teichoic acids
MLMQCSSPETEFWEIPVFEVNNRHILVTGGSSGFGRHFARFLASKITISGLRAAILEHETTAPQGLFGKFPK